MNVPHDLLTEFVARYPAQPATAFWRGVEIHVLARAGIPEGLGLDLGCGDGILSDILFKRIGRRPRLVGVDIDPLETAAARRFDFYERVHTSSGEAIPEPDAIFDYVVSNSVLEHIPDLEPVIAEIGRLLKPGGRFFFTVPAPGFHRNLSGSLLPGVPRSRYIAGVDRRLAHFHYLSAEDWSAMCGRHGLTVDTAQGYLNRAETRRWEMLSRMTGGLVHSMSLGRSRPIEIQRRLKLRAMQNRSRLPRPVAASLARLIAAGIRGGEPGAPPSCLLVAGCRAVAA